jgi:CheY-like chemotaxis protein
MGRGRPKRTAAKRVRKPAPVRKRASSPPTRRAVETALASLAHDIRTPLTGILALSDLLVASDLPERERGWARSIRGAADHLAQLTSIVLDAVKADRAGLVLRKDVFSPRKLADQVAASLSARAGAGGLTADIAIAADLPPDVVGDPVRLRAALENLIDNAVKFTPRGRVGFSVIAEPAPRGRVLLHFAVTDSGIGLTRTEIAKLFRPFAQATHDVPLRYGGTGLGLALVKRLAKAMGGDLAVVSKKDEGSTFTLTVSVGTARGSGKVAQGGAASTAKANVSRRILCAEDNPYGRMVLNAMLTELGHRVDFASSGEAAVTAVANGGYDLVLMDVTLPGFDGLEAARRIRALPGAAGHIPIIGISGRGSEDDKRSALAAGMTDYLTKPVSAAALLEAIGKVSPA